MPHGTAIGEVSLPSPTATGQSTLEATLARRRSVRTFSAEPLAVPAIGQLLWAGQGVTGGVGYRTAPSAGALYPLELYVATAAGLDHYDPGRHALTRLSDRDPRPALYDAALAQSAVREAPAVFVIAAVYARTAGKYGVRAERYVHLEAGHAAQNILLQAVALSLAAVPIGAFEDGGVQDALALPPDHQPLYLIPVGKPRG